MNRERIWRASVMSVSLIASPAAFAQTELYPGVEPLPPLPERTEPARRLEPEPGREPLLVCETLAEDGTKQTLFFRGWGTQEAYECDPQTIEVIPLSQRNEAYQLPPSDPEPEEGEENPVP